MKWFEHHTNDRDLPHSKIIRSKFGAEGYGIYTALLEVIGENVLEDNSNEWGQVAKIHDIESLAVECATSPDRLKEFLEFCNEKEIFEKKDGKLYTYFILDRLDNYAKRIKRTQSDKSSSSDEQSSNKVQLSSTNFEPSTNKVQLSTTLQKQKQKHNLTNVKLVETEEPEKVKNNKNELVEHTLEEFKRVYGFYPTDKYSRRVAWNTVQRIRKVTADRIGGELTDSRLKKGLSMFFDWVQAQESLENIQKLETCKLKINIFMEQLPSRKETSEVK